MSYDQKIESARGIIEQFNESSSKKIDIDQFFEDLKALGGTTNSAIKMCSWEDLGDCGTQKDDKSVSKGIPRLIARQVAFVFRTDLSKEKQPKVITEKKALRLSNRELLEAYDPRDPESPVAKRLKQLSKGQPCIVFENQTNKVHIKASLECLEDLLDDNEPLPHYLVEGIPHKIYKVGLRPNKTVPENPLFPGHALRGSEAVCHKTTRSWASVPQRARIVLRLALSTGELKINQVGDVHNTLDLVVGKEETQAIQTISSRFPQATLRYAELEVSGNLPTLIIVRNGKAKPKQDPFYGEGHKTF